MTEFFIPSTAALPPAVFIPAFLGIMVLAGLVASFAGFGGNLVSVPLLAWLCGDIWTAVTLMLVIGGAQNVALAVSARRGVRWRVLWKTVFWSALGIVPGMLCVQWLPRRAVLVCMGCVVALGGVMGLQAQRGFSHEENPRLRLRDKAMLLFAGLMHGAFACGGPTVALAARRLLPEKNAFRATLFAYWLFLNALAFCAVWRHFSIKPVAGLFMVSIPAMVFTGWLGVRLAGRVSQRAFARATALLLILSGLAAIANALAK